jgi:hypothetical protein
MSHYKHPLYQTWNNLIQRCQNPKCPNYKYYGAKGITVSERWKNFASFVQDMGNRPTPRHILERTDIAKGYEPGNCRWSVPGGIMFEGVVLSIGEWAKRLGMNSLTLRTRLEGQEVDEAFCQPIQRKRDHPSFFVRYSGRLDPAITPKGTGEEVRNKMSIPFDGPAGFQACLAQWRKVVEKAESAGISCLIEIVRSEKEDFVQVLAKTVAVAIPAVA